MRAAVPLLSPMLALVFTVGCASDKGAPLAPVETVAAKATAAPAETDDDIPENMAPVLKKFFASK